MAKEEEKQESVKIENKPAQTPAPPQGAKLPDKLLPIAGCFSAPKKAFIAAFENPKDGEIAFAKEVNFAVQAMVDNEYLISCAKAYPDALINAIKNVALTGSTLNPVLKQGYLVPYKGKITFAPSYMGMTDILVNSGLARKIEAHVVFQGDKFTMELGSGGKLSHIPDPWGKRTPETALGCYYYIVLADGTELYDTLSKDEVDAIKMRSPSVQKGKQSPWDTDYLEMMKKTAIRRAYKVCPKTGISDNKVKAVEAAFDYDEKVDKDAALNQTEKPDTFEEDIEYEEL